MWKITLRVFRCKLDQVIFKYMFQWHISTTSVSNVQISLDISFQPHTKNEVKKKNIWSCVMVTILGEGNKEIQDKEFTQGLLNTK